MRLFGADDDCGPLLDLQQVQRQLRLGGPIDEGVQTIEVARIVGTAGRALDFDGCFHPRNDALRHRVEQIEASGRAADSPIDVVRVDRAYFVADGHKRVSIARSSGQEFIDARVSRLQTAYELTSDIDRNAIERTAREGEFRRHSGMDLAQPDARFALTDVTGYGELLLAMRTFAYDQMVRTDSVLSASDVAGLWYRDEYLPLVSRVRTASAGLLDSLTDADVFLALHRQWRAWWGSECNDVDCAIDEVAANEAHRAAAARATLRRVLRRDQSQRSTADVLPLADRRGPEA